MKQDSQAGKHTYHCLQATEPFSPFSFCFHMLVPSAIPPFPLPTSIPLNIPYEVSYSPRFCSAPSTNSPPSASHHKSYVTIGHHCPEDIAR